MSTCSRRGPWYRLDLTSRALLSFAIVALGLLALAPTALAASASTNPATKVHQTSVVLNGHLDPSGDPGILDCDFEWGPDTSYGSSVSCNEGDSFTSPADVSANLGFLTPGQTYHFRLSVQTTSAGVLTGADQSFSLKSIPGSRPEIAVFGPDGTSESSFAEGSPGLEAQVGVDQLAFNQVTRKLYVLDTIQSGVYGFDASSSPSFQPLAGFTPLSTTVSASNPALAVDNTSLASAGNIYVARGFGPMGLVGYSSSGAPLSGFPIATDKWISGVAIDSAGNVWVNSRSQPDHILKYSSAGVFQSSIDVSSQFLFNIAFDSSDDLYAAGAFGQVRKFTAASDYTESSEVFDSDHRFESQIAVDPSTKQIFAVDERFDELHEYDPSGNLLLTFPTVSVQGVAVDATSEYVYVSSTATDKIHVYGPLVFVVFPTVATEAASAVTPNSATLNATVDPEGEPITDCRFEWGPGFSFGNSTPCTPTPSGSGDVEVSASLSGLALDAGYSFRVVATNANGTSKGQNLSFETKPAVKGLKTDPATSVTATAATLNGALDPDGVAVSDCHFAYLTEHEFGTGGFAEATDAPCVPSPGSAPGSVAVSAPLTGLEPGTKYRFRLQASNSFGATFGATLGFITVGPRVGGERVSEITETEARLSAEVMPAGKDTTCLFEYGFSQAYGEQIPCSPATQPAINEVQEVKVKATAGQFKLGFEGQTTADIDFNAPASAVEAALAALGSIGSSNVAVTGGPGNAAGSSPYFVTFQGPFAGFDVAEMTASGGTLSGGLGTSEVKVATKATPTLTVSSELTGLLPGTTYHFRVVATNAEGTNHGPDFGFVTYGQLPPFDPCPNDEFRTGPSAKLPDCRAYEQASPVHKNGSDVTGSTDLVQASSAGGAVTFFATAGIPGGEGAQDLPTYVARRGAGAWSTQGILPPASMGSRAFTGGWTPDLSFTFARAVAPDGSLTAFVSRDSSGALSTIVPHTPDALYFFAGASSDGSKVFFEVTGVELTPDAAPGKDNLYVFDRDTNTIELAGVLPDSACGSPPCTPAGGSFAGPYDWFDGTSPITLRKGGAERHYYLQAMHAISRSGERAYFTAGGTGQIYLRKDAAGPNPTTAHVSATERGTPDPNGTKPAIFTHATPTGSVAFFTSCEKLTDDSTAVSTAGSFTCATKDQGPDLYAYDAASGDLADLTVDTAANPRGADVKGVLGIDEDGSHVYFAANGDLDGTGPATLGDCQGAPVASGDCSLYLWNEGAIAFIARLDLSPGSVHRDIENWRPVSTFYNAPTSRVSSDGQTLLFVSQRKLTAEENFGPGCLRDFTGASHPGICPQIYRYHAPTKELLCISCNPTRTAPRESAPSLQSVGNTGPLLPRNGAVPAIFVRNLSADGNRVFFESPEKLIAADINGDGGCPSVGDLHGGGGDSFPACLDVYEWEAQGTGSCESAQFNGGCLYLLSTGTSSSPSFFADASATGDEAFIFTRDQLVPQDKDQLQDAYAVSVGGGLASQHEVLEPPCDLSGGACEGPSSSALPSTGAGSAVFEGPGDRPQETRPPRRCPKGKRKVRRAGKTRCVKRQQARDRRANKKGKRQNQRGSSQ